MDSPADGVPLELISTLRAARYIAVLTGAGISAESGVPITDLAGYVLHGHSGQVLPALVRAAWGTH